MTAMISAAVRHAAAKATLEMDLSWLIPAKPFFRIREVAALTEMSRRSLEDYFDKTQFFHAYNAGEGIRDTKRIPRFAVVDLLVRSARYKRPEKFAAVTSLLREFGPEELLAFAQEANRLAANITRSSRG